jgi:hypothetical protein
MNIISYDGQRLMIDISSCNSSTSLKLVIGRFNISFLDGEWACTMVCVLVS